MFPKPDDFKCNTIALNAIRELHALNQWVEFIFGRMYILCDGRGENYIPYSDTIHLPVLSAEERKKLIKFFSDNLFKVTFAKNCIYLN
ncbi:MAG: hypothetical protein WC668_00615 [Patescibacteria group bacterium]|jgi:hypothetical protein